MIDLKRHYVTASVVDNERVVFNVGGNKYRLVVKLWFPGQVMGLTRADLVKIIGSRSRVSEVLNRRRDLTLAMISRIREELGISADTLIWATARGVNSSTQ